MLKQKPSKVSKTLICNCYSLDLFLIPDASILARGEHSTIITKSSNAASLYISATPENQDKIKVKVVTDESEFNQTVEITRKLITFGLRRYFLCGCGRKVNSLYLKRGTFACRHCHNLVYEITRLRKGTWLYKLNRSEKIKAAEHQVRRISYGRIIYTRKARQTMAMAKKYF